MEYNTKNLKELIAMQEEKDKYEYARFLLSVKCPGMEKKILRLAKNLAKALEEVRKEFPEAEYYTSGGDRFALVMGKTHTDNDPNSELCAFVSSDLVIGGGDW